VSEEAISGPPLADAPFQSVPQMVAARAATEPRKIAVRQRAPSGKWADLSWADLDARRAGIAAGLQALGVDRGEVIAIVSPNSAEMLVAELAAQTVGAAVAPIFAGYSPQVLHHCLADSGARIAFAGSAVQQHQLAQARQLDRIVVLDDRPLPGDHRALPLSALLGTARSRPRDAQFSPGIAPDSARPGCAVSLGFASRSPAPSGPGGPPPAPPRGR